MKAPFAISLVLLASCGATPEVVRPAPTTGDHAAPATPRAPATRAAPPPHDAAAESESCGPAAALSVPSDPAAALRDARALRDAGQLVQAADLLEATVRAFPDHELALAAAELSLDALNHAGGDGPANRAACIARMGVLAVEYRSLFACETAPRGRADTCARLETLRCLALHAEGAALADQGEAARASEVFERVHRTHCASGADHALYNAALLARRAGDPARADALVAELQRGFPESPVLRAPPP